MAASALSDQPRRRRIRLIVAGVGLLLVVIAAAATPVVHSIVERIVRQRADGMAKRAGVVLTIGSVEVGLRPLVTLRDVLVSRNHAPLVQADRITADLPIRAALQGARRPQAVGVHGLKAHVRVVDGRLSELEALAQQWRSGRSEKTGKKGAPSPLRLRVLDGVVTVHVSGKGVQYTGRELRLAQVEVDAGRAGGRFAATFEGVATGRAHALVERDEDGTWTARVEAAPVLTIRAPPGLPLGIDRVRFRGLRWRHKAVTLTGLHVTSAVGDVRVASLSTGVQAKRIAVQGVKVRALPSRLLPTTTQVMGEVVVAVERAQLDGARALRSGGLGAVIVRGVTARIKNQKSKFRLGYGRVARIVKSTTEMPYGAIAVDLHKPDLHLGDLTALALPAQVKPVKALLLTLKRMWAEAHAARRTTANTAGWARPAAPKLSPAEQKAARRLRHKRRREARGKPAYTAQYAEATAGLPALLAATWARSSEALERVARLPLQLDVYGGSAAFRTGDLTFGADRFNLRWRGGSVQPVFSASLRPVVADKAGGSIELTLVGNAKALQRVDFSVRGSALARLATGLDKRLATGKSPDISLSATVVSTPEGGGQVTGRVGLRDVGVDWDRFAPGPITGLAVDAPFELRWPASLRRMSLHTGHVRFGGTETKYRGRATAIAHLTGGKRPIVDFTFSLPDQDCGTLVASLPAAMLPTLGEVSARGRLSAWLDLRFDVAHPYYSELDFKLDDKKCRNLRIKAVDVAKFNDDFSRRVNEDGKILNNVKIGPLSDAWVDFGKLPPWVPYAMITTEDGGFWRHRGLNAFLLNRAIRLDLHYGRFVYGGSTITQQLAKNLFFTRSKFLARKLEELIAVWAMERTLKKVRIIEIYMNAVEFAPHIYGVTRGAMHYFGKRPSRLTPLEAAWLGSIKPCPRCGDSAFRHKQYRSWYQTRLLEILTRMHRNEVITDAQFEAEANTVPQFLGWTADKLNRRFSHPVPLKKPPAIQRLDRGRGKKMRRRK